MLTIYSFKFTNMKKNIKLVEENSGLDLSFNLPTSALSENELASLYGGNVEEDCTCRAGKLECDCNGTGSTHTHPK